LANADFLLLKSPPAFASNLLGFGCIHTYKVDKVSRTQQSDIERAHSDLDARDEVQQAQCSNTADASRCCSMLMPAVALIRFDQWDLSPVQSCHPGCRTTLDIHHHSCPCFFSLQVHGQQFSYKVCRTLRCATCHAVPWYSACNVCRQPACRQARHCTHIPLQVSYAKQRPNNKSNSQEHPPAAAVNTLALLELLLTQPKVDTETVSETSLLVDDSSAMPESSQTDTHLTSPGISHQLPTSSYIWTETWQPLEVNQPVHAKQAQAVAAAHQMPVGLPSLRFWRQQQQQQQQQQLPGQSSQKTRDRSVPRPKGWAAATMMRNAQMQLQGIEPAARLQLMALCMASLEDLTELLKGVSIRYARYASVSCSSHAIMSSHAAIAIYAQCVTWLQDLMCRIHSELVLVCSTSRHARVANREFIACCVTSTAMLTVPA